uniref:Uncharacterized protein n=1 Tax=Plectus sambesii TaxID=2011161 RepID=A0A914XGX8_9BILA
MNEDNTPRRSPSPSSSHSDVSDVGQKRARVDASASSSSATRGNFPPNCPLGSGGTRAVGPATVVVVPPRRTSPPEIRFVLLVIGDDGRGVLARKRLVAILGISAEVGADACA